MTTTPSPLAKAIGYVRNQRVALRRFLDDGRLRLRVRRPDAADRARLTADRVVATQGALTSVSAGRGQVEAIARAACPGEARVVYARARDARLTLEALPERCTGTDAAGAGP